MRILPLILLLSFVGSPSNLPVLEPRIHVLNLNEADAARYTELCNDYLELMVQNITYEDMTAEQKKVWDEAMLYDCEMKPDYWDIIGGGCSWYCGGGPEEVSASSTLPSQGANNYKASNAHDLSYETAWVEGVKGYGIGEYLEYHFAPNSPRITSIMVANGYVKSEVAWKNNSRVKKLKLFYNDVPWAILSLDDSRSDQAFSVDTLGFRPKWSEGDVKDLPWKLKFEVLEVYEGEKYDDVVISEIYFNGVDVHCFAEGTMVTMADGSAKPIEGLEKGDRVLSYNRETQKTEPAKIKALAHPIHDELIEITFSNGQKLTCTPDHPLLGESNTWYSQNPLQAIRDYKLSMVLQLKAGVGIQGIDETLYIERINSINQQLPTHTILKLSQNNVFFANGVMVGVGE